MQSVQELAPRIPRLRSGEACVGATSLLDALCGLLEDGTGELLDVLLGKLGVENRARLAKDGHTLPQRPDDLVVIILGC